MKRMLITISYDGTAYHGWQSQPNAITVQDVIENAFDAVIPLNLQFFAKEGEGGEKTEEPTSKKLDDARKEGKVAKSKELTAAFDLIVLFLVLKVFISFVGERLIGIFTQIYNKIPEFLEVNRGGNLIRLMVLNEFFRQILCLSCLNQLLR